MTQSIEEARKLFAEGDVEERPPVTLGELDKDNGRVDIIEEIAKIDKAEALADRGLGVKPGTWIRIGIARSGSGNKIPAIKATRSFVEHAPEKEGIDSSLKGCKDFIDRVWNECTNEGPPSFAIKMPTGDPLYLAEYVDKMREAGFSVYRLLV